MSVGFYGVRNDVGINKFPEIHGANAAVLGTV